MEPDARVLFDDFCHWRQKTRSYHDLPFKQTKVRWDSKREGALDALAVWCHERALDPRLFLYVLFVRRWWRCPPRWDHLIPKSTKAVEANLEAYHALPTHEVLAYKQYVTDQRQQAKTDVGLVYDRRTDLSHSVEALKRRYAERGMALCCIDEMVKTLGYHPHSKICQKCDQKASCIQALTEWAGTTVVRDRKGVCDDNATKSHTRRYGETAGSKSAI